MFRAYGFKRSLLLKLKSLTTSEIKFVDILHYHC